MGDATVTSPFNELELKTTVESEQQSTWAPVFQHIATAADGYFWRLFVKHNSREK